MLQTRAFAGPVFVFKIEFNVVGNGANCTVRDNGPCTSACVSGRNAGKTCPVHITNFQPGLDWALKSTMEPKGSRVPDAGLTVPAPGSGRIETVNASPAVCTFATFMVVFSDPPIIGDTSGSMSEFE